MVLSRFRVPSICLLYLLVICWLLPLIPARAQNYKPPFPRLVFQRPGGISGGAVQNFFSRYDLAIHGGAGINAYALNDSIRRHNPETLILGTSRQGIWPGNPLWPPGTFVYSAYYGTLTAPAQPGDTQIRVNSTAGLKMNSVKDDIYALLGEDDWISFTSYDDTTLYGIPVSADYAINKEHPAGDSLRRPIRFIGFGYIHNLTPFASDVNGQPFWAYFIDQRFTANKQDFSRFDGVFYDSFRFFFWSGEFNSTVDLDRNGLDDMSEPGKGLNWFNAQWAQGIQQMLPYERQKFSALNPGKPAVIAINMGSAQEGDPYPIRYCDGMMWEGYMRFAYTCPELIRVNQLWEAAHDSVFMMVEDYVDRLSHSMDYKKMRYGLTAAVVSGAYYGMTYGNEYSMSLYYDEFDVELGYPTSIGQKIPGLGDVFVRFFDHGAAICNASGRVVTVTAAMLSGLPGYAGPYYRFLGGQRNMAGTSERKNSGGLFDAVELYGELGGVPKQNIGDGILLLSHPDTVVADIIVGTCYYNDTSPGTARARFEGAFYPVQDKAHENSDFTLRNRCYSQWVSSDSNGIGYYYSDKRFGMGSVTFRPTIGVAGYYEISEWHPMVGETPSAYQEAADVPFEIVIANTRKLSGIIDQTKNYGRWNRIAILYLPEGTGSYVRITNQCNGFVAADAMRFRHLKRVTPDVTPPLRPEGFELIR